ncbi:MAG: hypothetical protein QOC61_1957, partial [Acidobacteriota bacterium]|nr:hypothetical protein [Acidobacteriota bacterium]
MSTKPSGFKGRSTEAMRPTSLKDSLEDFFRRERWTMCASSASAGIERASSESARARIVGLV